MRVRVRTPVAVSLLAVLALLSTVVAALAAPVVATASAAAASAAPVASAASAVDRSAAAPSASGGLTRLRVVDHNIEKRSAALDRAISAAQKSQADIITLQEVCWWQVDELRRAHPQWTLAWKVERDNEKCRKRVSAADVGNGIRSQVGNVAIWTGGATGATTSVTLSHQRFDGDHAGLACVAWVDGARHRACSVHLISPSDRRETGVRTAQAKDVRRIANRWLSQDELVVLGGDFNSQPGRRTMRYLYEHNGVGTFREATTRRLGGMDCRCRQITGDGKRVKIDYVFFSANRIEVRAYRRLRIVKTPSDHHLLIGWADVDASAR